MPCAVCRVRVRCRMVRNIFLLILIVRVQSAYPKHVRIYLSVRGMLFAQEIPSLSPISTTNHRRLSRSFCVYKRFHLGNNIMGLTWWNPLLIITIVHIWACQPNRNVDVDGIYTVVVFGVRHNSISFEAIYRTLHVFGHINCNLLFWMTCVGEKRTDTTQHSVDGIDAVDTLYTYIK